MTPRVWTLPACCVDLAYRIRAHEQLTCTCGAQWVGPIDPVNRDALACMFQEWIPSKFFRDLWKRTRSKFNGDVRVMRCHDCGPAVEGCEPCPHARGRNPSVWERMYDVNECAGTIVALDLAKP